ncbi:MAG: hypothetical protein IKU13_07395 [Clostridia bacterium]|nr:hypothetical protein [Clostridia bacterium]
MAYALEYLNNGFDTEDKKWKGTLVDLLKDNNMPADRIKAVEEYME